MMKELGNSWPKAAAVATAATTGLVMMWNLATPDFARAQGNAHAMEPPPQSGEILKTGMPPQGNTPVPETEEPWTRKAAYRASTNQIVLHYGEEIKWIEIEAEALRRDGYPTIAVPGGPKGQVEAFVGRSIIRHSFDQNDLDSGTLAGLVTDVFYVKFGPKNPEMISP